MRQESRELGNQEVKPGMIDSRVRPRDDKKIRRTVGCRSQKGHRTGEVKSVGWTGGGSGSTKI